MLSVVVFTGVAGSGKTTVARELERRGVAALLKPFTTRPPRSAADDEYHFRQNVPTAARRAWIIHRPPYHYGMLTSELDGARPKGIAVSVFDPLQLDALERFRRGARDIEVIIVALDTIDSEAQQHVRVQGAPERLQNQASIDQVRAILAKADVTLRGNESDVCEAAEAICRILTSRGGVVPKEYLAPLIRAGSLLVNSDIAHLESASYDLRVGDEVWCGGAFIDLSQQQPLFEIPPYSYAIVKAEESAAVPSFLIAQFDIKVSHFLSGVILSNGPQVDPGYHGDLFCMTFNGSSVPRALRKGDHFSTIHFITTAKSGEPYSGPYNFQERLRKNMPIGAATGPGGAIFSKISEEINSAKAELRREIPKERSSLYLSLIAILGAVSLAVAGFGIWAAQDASKAAAEARSAAAQI